MGCMIWSMALTRYEGSNGQAARDTEREHLQSQQEHALFCYWGLMLDDADPVTKLARFMISACWLPDWFKNLVHPLPWNGLRHMCLSGNVRVDMCNTTWLPVWVDPRKRGVMFPCYFMYIKFNFFLKGKSQHVLPDGWAEVCGVAYGWNSQGRISRWQEQHPCLRHNQRLSWRTCPSCQLHVLMFYSFDINRHLSNTAAL